jgi:hypothetical protein
VRVRDADPTANQNKKTRPMWQCALFFFLFLDFFLNFSHAGKHEKCPVIKTRQKSTFLTRPLPAQYH